MHPNATGWLFEDHFSLGHIHFEVGDVIWCKPFETYAKAATEAHHFGWISYLQLNAISHPEEHADPYERRIKFRVRGVPGEDRFIHRGFIPQRSA